ncbi:MAG: metallophosphoesterase [Anaerolineae bacterium]|nr:metallophosphoesterase [Anaerolineae bacterium]
MLARRRLTVACLLIAGLLAAAAAWAYLGGAWAASEIEYTFFVAGHTYGVPGIDNAGVHPRFRAWFPAINSRGADLGVLTGDIVICGTVKDWDDVDRDLASLSMPVYFAVGNHDMSDRDLYTRRYGPTYYAFRHMADLFIVLDGELDQGKITGDQLAFLERTLAAEGTRNVFVFVHKLVWVIDGTPYEGLKASLNARNGYDFHGNYWRDVHPLLRGIDSSVYVFAGDVGVTWAMPLFYQQEGNVRLVASGMGGAQEENYLLIDVGPRGVQIEAQRLDGRQLQQRDLKAYDLAHYRG